METTLQMKSVQTLRKERENKLTELFNSTQLFFAFSEEQFLEGKPELKEGDKLVSIGAGGFLPKSNIEKFEKGFKEIKKWYSKEIKNNKLIEKEIIYEMYNHEVFYTSDLDDIFDMYPNLSKEYLRKLYNKEKQKIDF
jgi:hypothetical protein